ncbi:MAG: ADP-ribosylglycohydrolase family protein [Thermogemmatispora sp.]|uniref:ADP-ribosylglycohydrolase family protein n=1 Tax=Thermogemmatispora sp. TaxID=1968838 RepID=UPI0026135394|nr:ADP-ribosylglycohydrolase family protein [Thermogemmatispora sp.]MBX5455381.1 ADP-ribosylglycohydrolase family protein [Thermogemmatispora sp.]
MEEPERQQPPRQTSVPPCERFEGAMLYASIGDALGWPTEFLIAGSRQCSFELPVRRFVPWTKRVGGKWWGYEDTIGAGEYSDDTQLMLAVARSIDEAGHFIPEYFAYIELPLWLQYERGGGRTVKTAARKLLAKRASWLNNFYQQGDLDYRQAGANGAAMRNLPIALVHVDNKQELIRDSFYNAIITHGHPRAILGTILFGLAVHCALTLSAPPPPPLFIECILDGLRQVPQVIRSDQRLQDWLHTWNRGLLNKELNFVQLYQSTLHETVQYLKQIPAFLPRDPKDYYTFVGALDPQTKGSGIATVCVAIYLFLKYLQRPQQGIIVAVNTFGSDTDTIALFLGSLLGAFHGLKAIPPTLLDEVQDRRFLLDLARRLHTIAKAAASPAEPAAVISDREASYFSILSWEVAFHEMFHGEYQDGDRLIHPTLGSGAIQYQEEQPLRRDGYVARLVRVLFKCGQTCVFHSRVKENGSPSESLASEVVRALQERD